MKSTKAVERCRCKIKEKLYNCLKFQVGKLSIKD